MIGDRATHYAFRRSNSETSRFRSLTGLSSGAVAYKELDRDASSCRRLIIVKQLLLGHLLTASVNHLDGRSYHLYASWVDVRWRRKRGRAGTLSGSTRMIHVRK
jgi:hypothetical protein